MKYPRLTVATAWMICVIGMTVLADGEVAPLKEPPQVVSAEQFAEIYGKRPERFHTTIAVQHRELVRPSPTAQGTPPDLAALKALGDSASLGGAALQSPPADAPQISGFGFAPAPREDAPIRVGGEVVTLGGIAD